MIIWLLRYIGHQRPWNTLHWYSLHQTYLTTPKNMEKTVNNMHGCTWVFYNGYRIKCTRFTREAIKAYNIIYTLMFWLKWLMCVVNVNYHNMLFIAVFVMRLISIKYSWFCVVVFWMCDDEDEPSVFPQST